MRIKGHIEVSLKQSEIVTEKIISVFKILKMEQFPVMMRFKVWL